MRAVFFLFLMACFSLAKIPTDGLVAYFPFNGNIENQSAVSLPPGENHNGVFVPDRFGNESAAISFDGTKSSYAEFPDDDAYSISTTGALAMSVWMSPDTLTCPVSDDGYIHWMGKGTFTGTDKGNMEWGFRMYNEENSANRPNRISAYAFNLAGGLGSGSYVQEPVTVGEWIHFLAIYDTGENLIRVYKNGVLKDSDSLYDETYKVVVQNGDSPLRIGTRSLWSFFRGKIDDLRIYSRVLSESEILELYRENPSAGDSSGVSSSSRMESSSSSAENPDFIVAQSDVSPLRLSVVSRTLSVAGIRQGSNLVVTDALGQVLVREKIAGNHRVLHFPAAGNYFLKLGNEIRRVQIR